MNNRNKEFSMRYLFITAVTTSLIILAGDSRSQGSDPTVVGTADAGSTKALPYGGQKTCPVTGEDLSSMGSPIPVTVKGQMIYVCCKSCVAKVQRDPDKYLRKVKAERASR
jgi:hypothetical protein